METENKSAGNEFCDKLAPVYPSVGDRYYRKLYKIDMKGNVGEDYCVMVHSNRICIITLAPSHNILREKKEVTKVDFQINKRTNRLENHLSGKRKRGAQPLAENSGLCFVTCSDGSTYQPCGCLKSNLIEVNENLVKIPTLLTSKPDSEGYIAIVLTKLQEHKQVVNKLLTPEQYAEALATRAQTSANNQQKLENTNDEGCSTSLNSTEKECSSSDLNCGAKQSETSKKSDEIKSCSKDASDALKESVNMSENGLPSDTG